MLTGQIKVMKHSFKKGKNQNELRYNKSSVEWVSKFYGRQPHMNKFYGKQAHKMSVFDISCSCLAFYILNTKQGVPWSSVFSKGQGRSMQSEFKVCIDPNSFFRISSKI